MYMEVEFDLTLEDRVDIRQIFIKDLLCARHRILNAEPESLSF